VSASQGLSGAVTLETRCVAGPVSQLSTDPFATVPTGVQEEISRFVAQDTSGFQQRSHAPQPPTQDNVSSTAFWAARRSFTSTKRRTCFLICANRGCNSRNTWPVTSPAPLESSPDAHALWQERHPLCPRVLSAAHRQPTHRLQPPDRQRRSQPDACRRPTHSRWPVLQSALPVAPSPQEGHCRCNTQDELL